MKNETGLSKTKISLSIINILVCIAAVVGCCILLFGSSTPAYMIAAIIEIISLVFNIFYTLHGFRKKYALSFRIYMFLSALVSLTILTGSCADAGNAGTVFAIMEGIVALQSASLMVLSLGKDIGVKVSAILSVFVILVPLYILISVMIEGRQYDVLTNLGFLASSVSSVLLIIAKYTDKYERKKGTNQKL